MGSKMGYFPKKKVGRIRNVGWTRIRGEKRETRFCSVGRHKGDKNLKEKKDFIGVEKHIRITDAEIGKQIEQIMEVPEYSKSKTAADGSSIMTNLKRKF